MKVGQLFVTPEAWLRTQTSDATLLGLSVSGRRPKLPAGVMDMHGAPTIRAAIDLIAAGAVAASNPVGSTWPTPEPDVR